MFGDERPHVESVCRKLILIDASRILYATYFQPWVLLARDLGLLAGDHLEGMF